MKATLVLVGNEGRNSQAKQQRTAQALQWLDRGSIQRLHLHAKGAMTDRVPREPDADDLPGTKQAQRCQVMAIEQPPAEQHGQSPVQEQGADPSREPGNGARTLDWASHILSGPFLRIVLRRPFKPRAEVFSFHLYSLSSDSVRQLEPHNAVASIQVRLLQLAICADQIDTTRPDSPLVTGWKQ